MTALISAEPRAAAAAADLTHARDSLKTSRAVRNRSAQPSVDVSHKPGGRLPLLSARPAVTLASLKRAATSFTASEQRHDECEQFALDSVAAAI